MLRGSLLAFAVLLAACAPPTPVDDAGVSGEQDSGVLAPRCTVTADAVTCVPRITAQAVNAVTRDVYWQTPVGDAPDAGFPVVILYQGSFFGPTATWGTAKSDLPFGGYEQARLQALLLEHGFTVISPSAVIGLAWQTNSGVPWALTTDRPFIDGLLASIANGEYGPADLSRLYATGISSGGYMTSRMALSYPGRFRALAIQSGSWATCVGVVCVLPGMLPADHPPTRFLHGRDDVTVPLSTAETYHQQLQHEGFESDLIIAEGIGHAWLPESPEKIVEWFEAH